MRRRESKHEEGFVILKRRVNLNYLEEERKNLKQKEKIKMLEREAISDTDPSTLPTVYH